VNYALSLNNLGWMSRRADRPREAVAYYVELLAMPLPDDHAVLAYAHLNLAESHLALGDVDAALPHYEQARARMEKLFGAEHPEVAMTVGAHGAALARRRDWQAGIPLLERAHALLAGSAEPVTRGEVAYFLAEALWDSGRDRARARRLAAESAALLRQGGSARADEVERWLRGRR
jgi:tetratricopeptide (TPR) repeat protein